MDKRSSYIRPGFIQRNRSRIIDAAVAVVVVVSIGVPVTMACDAMASAGAARHHTVPACTDAIADAGGICKGEPTSTGLPPCTTEDSVTDCYWDAATRSNGRGVSFVILHGETFPIEAGTGVPVCDPPLKMSDGAECYGDSK